MKKEKSTLRFEVITLIVLFAALSRLISYPSNFAPIGAMALLGAAYYSNRYLAFVIPIFLMWISDFILNNEIYGSYFDHFVWFYKGSISTYLAFSAIVALGMFSLKKILVRHIAQFKLSLVVSSND